MDTEQRVYLLYIPLNLQFLSYNPEEITQRCSTTLFRAYSSSFHISLMPCCSHSYCIRELSSQQRMNTNPSIVTLPSFLILQEDGDKKGLVWQQVWVTLTQKLYPPH